MGNFIANELNKIESANTWCEFLEKIEKPTVGRFGARRYQIAGLQGSLCYNDLVKKTEVIFQKNTDSIKSQEKILIKLKALDQIHLAKEKYNTFLFCVLKAFHFLKSFCGNFFYDRSSVIKKLSQTILGNGSKSFSNLDPVPDDGKQKNIVTKIYIPEKPKFSEQDQSENIFEFFDKNQVEKEFPTDSNQLNSEGKCSNGIFNLNKESLKESHPESLLLNTECDLVVKKNVLQNEFLIGAKLSHKNLAKSYAFFKDHENKGNIVMEKIEGETITINYNGKKPKLENTTVEELIRSLKETCIYLFDNEICWGDVNNGNLMLTKNNQLKIVDFGYWHKQPDMAERAFQLLLGAIEAVGWILKSSKLRENTYEKDDAYPFIFPEEFFGKKVQLIQVLSIGQNNKENEDLKPCFEKILELQKPEELKDYLSSYFNIVLEKFKNEFKDEREKK